MKRREDYKVRSYRMTEGMDLAVVLLDADLKFHYANDQARRLLDTKSVLLLGSDQLLYAVNPADNASWQQKLLVAGVSRSRAQRADSVTCQAGAGSSAQIFQRANGKSLFATIVSLSHLPEYQDLVKHGIAVAVFVSDPERNRTLQRDLLKQTYTLGDREVEVCEAYLNCASLEGVADALGISINTVKTHFKSIYEKTESRGLAALMKLLVCYSVSFEKFR